MITQKDSTIEITPPAGQTIGTRLGILRLLTCGSVDDGKSTLIGRLLLETGAVYEDHLQSLQLETKRHGTTELAVDPALIVDGLEDERAQGITIDVAYRYLRSPRRKIIIADSPGHEQYTRNMVTAASRSDVALLLVDARKGIVQQTKRHALIASMLGIKRFILATNKMDLVDYRSNVFHEITGDFHRFTKAFEELDIVSIPLSGLCGDNVCRRSENMDWYQGPTLIETLESSQASRGNPADGFRLPIQRVVRPDSEFRGVSGTIATGKIRVHDPIEILPQRRTSKIQSIITMDGEYESACAGQAVTITLADEIDVARGDWIVSPGVSSAMSSELNARLVWMSTEPLVVGKIYWLKCGTKTVMAEVATMQSKICIETGDSEPASMLELNEIGQCHLLLHEPVVHESYTSIREMGSFILVDRISHETVAAGIISSEDNRSVAASIPIATERQFSQVTAAQRKYRVGHDSLSVVIAGRTSNELLRVAYDLELRLFNEGFHVGVINAGDLHGEHENDGSHAATGKPSHLWPGLQVTRSLSDMGLICISVFEAGNQELKNAIRRECSRNEFLYFDLDSHGDTSNSRDHSKAEDIAENIYSLVVSKVSGPK
ncbi:Sulfate adenylyltransferase subunit 1 [Bremerella volcania]|uniref:sulfate adenylyltransferase n=1 Tax=Bremerella volcania TaxID=2527984 RepID=A0A518C3B6_9BACT|nr:GTP-binding protein [Bremerella volcania]QDU73717.1 Sulfate adenylyltransferase subunit 1 [Bremerella volcania]